MAAPHLRGGGFPVLQLRERGFLPAPRLGGPVRHHHEFIP